jgi:hypothetical protein
MRITMKYEGGGHDGEIVFFDDDSPDTRTLGQDLAVEHYEMTDGGMVGRIFDAGSPTRETKGAPKYRYEIIDRKEDSDGVTVHIRLLRPLQKPQGGHARPAT